jgi:hypothetical protein
MLTNIASVFFEKEGKIGSILRNYCNLLCLECVSALKGGKIASFHEQKIPETD